ncbi:AI-2E family transporter [Mycoplasmatota bacterium zrk1]
MDKRIKKALYYLTVLAIIYMIYKLVDPVSSTLRTMFGLLLPFLFSFGGAFVLNNVVDFLVQRKVKRFIAVFIVVISFILFGVILIGQLLPMIFSQFTDIVNRGPEIVASITKVFDGFLSNFNVSLSEFELDWEGVLLEEVNSSYNLISKIISGLFNSLSFVFLTPILLIYFLYDYDKIRDNFKRFLIKHRHEKEYRFFKELERLLSRYVGGLLLVMLILSIVSFIIFTISGLENALLFGFIIGLTNLIPFFGNIIGGAIAVLFAVSQSTTLALIILVEVILLTFIESNFVTPYIQSKKFKIHPIVIILGITIFGYLLGFIGVLLAIPLIITIKLTIKHYRLDKIIK